LIRLAVSAVIPHHLSLGFMPQYLQAFLLACVLYGFSNICHYYTSFY
jgi:hypothetical protein